MADISIKDMEAILSSVWVGPERMKEFNITKDIIEKLWVEKKVDYYAYCPRYRYGILARKVSGSISGEHYVQETTYIHKDFEFDYRCVQNREDVLFRQAHPIYSDSANLPKFRRKEYIL